MQQKVKEVLKICLTNVLFIGDIVCKIFIKTRSCDIGKTYPKRLRE